MVQQTGDFSKYGNSSTNVQGMVSLSLSLSLVFVVAFHQTHLISKTDRQTDRKTERQRDRQTDVCLCLSVSFVWYLKTRICDSFFLRRIETPSNCYPIMAAKTGKTDRQTDSRQTYVLSIFVCLSRSFGISRREFDVAFSKGEN